MSLSDFGFLLFQALSDYPGFYSSDVKGYHFLADVRKLKPNTVRKSEKDKYKNWQSEVLILGPLGYGSSTLPLRHSAHG